MSARRGRWLRRCGAALLGFGSGLAVDEAIARALGLGQVTLTRGTLHAYHPEVGWTCAPDCDTDYELPGSFRVRVRCNSAGLRDRERARDAAPGTRRIAVLGDSFMWGFGVENDEVFAARLEHALPRSEVLNFGVNGYSSVQELVRYDCDARSYRPQLVIVAVCWNDLEDNFDSKDDGRVYLEERGGSFAVANRPVLAEWKPGLVQALRHSSSFFRFLEYASALHRLRLDEGERREREALDEDRAPKRAGAPRFTLVDLHARETEELARAWRGLRFVLAELRAAAARDGAGLLVLFDALKESRSLAAFDSALVAPDRARAARLEIELERPARRLATLCAELELPFLDLGVAFRAHVDPDALFLRGNNHWSPAGHALAAEVVAREILRRGLLPDAER